MRSCKTWLISTSFLDYSVPSACFFSMVITPKHMANAVKAHLDRKTHSGTLSAVDWPPQNQGLNIKAASH